MNKRMIILVGSFVAWLICCLIGVFLPTDIAIYPVAISFALFICSLVEYIFSYINFRKKKYIDKDLKKIGIIKCVLGVLLFIGLFIFLFITDRLLPGWYFYFYGFSVLLCISGAFDFIELRNRKIIEELEEEKDENKKEKMSSNIITMGYIVLIGFSGAFLFLFVYWLFHAIFG